MIASILSDPSSLGVLIGFVFVAAVAVIGWGFAHIGHDGQ